MYQILVFKFVNTKVVNLVRSREKNAQFFPQGFFPHVLIARSTYD